MNSTLFKQQAAQAAITYIPDDAIIGIGTGSTVNFLIDALPDSGKKIRGAVSSSEQSTAKLKAIGIPVIDANDVTNLSIYIDGADEINAHLHMIKGGGGALTREKIIAEIATQFICIADANKSVSLLGKFPLPIEVIPMALKLVMRQVEELDGIPQRREGFITDNGNWIIDVHGLTISDPVRLEYEINQIPGVVTCGLFARRGADILLLGTEQGVKTINSTV